MDGSQERVGILFPPGIGGFIANLAVVLAGKVPVNLELHAGARQLGGLSATSGDRLYFKHRAYADEVDRLPVAAVWRDRSGRRAEGLPKAKTSP